MISIPIAVLGAFSLLVLCWPVLARAIRQRRRPQFSLGRYFLMMLACAVLVFAGVRWRRVDRYLAMAQPWIDEQFIKSAAAGDRTAGHHGGLPEEQELMVLQYALRNLVGGRERVAAIKILCELRPADAYALLMQDAREQPDAEVKAVELRLIGLHRRPDAVDFLLECMQGHQPAVRAAAADALGLIHQPPYDTPLEPSWEFYLGVGNFASDPPFSIARIVELQHPHGEYKHWPADFRITSQRNTVAPSAREALEHTMLNGASTDEREAAARALVSWPPSNYKLRLIEWGVWINDRGELKLLQSVLDEIPPFVHRTGNPVATLKDRINGIMTVTKPVIQLTTDVPLALDMEVQIKHGRPWFAYPRPDDFGATAATMYGRWRANRPRHEEFLSEFDNAQVAPLEDTREGYPWLKPSHRTYGPTSAGMGGGPNELISLGLHWQSVIVAPQQPAWMTPPDPGTDKRFKWWTDLRAVPCSWVSSRGESEKFIYYDGPTMARAPIVVTHDYKAATLTFTRQEMFPKPEQARYSNDRSDNFTGLPFPDSARGKPRRGMYIEVTSAPTSVKNHTTRYVSIWPLTVPDEGVATAEPKAMSMDACVAEFISLLTEQGMTAAEAQGMADSWKEQLFDSYGQRFIYLLTPEEYYEMCPIMVRPAPTEMVRVGIVLTEF